MIRSIFVITNFELMIINPFSKYKYLAILFYLVFSTASIYGQLSITSVVITSTDQGANYNYDIVAQNGSGTIYITPDTVPDWLTLTATGPGTATLAGTSSQADVGSHNITIGAHDNVDTVYQSYTLVVSNVNDAPQVTSIEVADAIVAHLYTYNITTTDLDGDDVTISSSIIPDWLTIDDNGDGTAVLHGTPTTVRSEHVVITVSDPSLSSTNQDFNILVVANSTPQFDNTPVTSVDQGDPYIYDITASDADNDTIIFTGINIPGWLTLLDNEDGTASLTGTPTQSEVGDHNVEIEVSDGIDSDTQAFTITVANVNDKPLFTSTPVTSGTQGVLYSYNITATDPDGDVIEITGTHPAWLTLNNITDSTATLTGTPTQAEVGPNNVTLNVTDGSLDTTQTFVITIANINDPPVFQSTPIISIPEDSLYSYTAVVTDIDGDTLQFSASELPSWLVFTDNEDGTATITGTPLNAQVGTHSVVLAVNDGTSTVNQSFNITVSNVNDAPVINSQTAQSINEDSSFTMTLSMLNVTDVDNTFPNGFSLVIQNGLNYSVSGSVVTPNANFYGVLTIPIQVNDGQSVNNLSQVFNFQLTVLPVNDAPVLSNVGTTAIAYDENDPAVIISSTIVISDVDNTTLTSATVSILTTDYVETEDVLSFTNTTNITGSWNSNTGILNLTGTANISEYRSALRSITYNNTSEDPTEGSRTIRFSVNDGTTTSNIASRLIEVTAINDAPVATSFSVTTKENTSTVINMMSRVSDAENDLNQNSLSVTVLPPHGSVSVNLLNGTITYTPANGYSGNDTFTYSICDNQLLCNTGVVTVNVSDQAPTAIDDIVVTDEDDSVKIDVLANDTDPQNNIDVTSIVITVQPLHGTATVNTGQNLIIYTPDLNYNGTDELSYSVCDLTEYCAEAKVSITINPVNDAPDINNDYIETNEDTQVIIEVLSNDNDSADPLSGIDTTSINITSAPQHGNAVVVSGTIRYTPSLNYFGYDTLEYSVQDLGNPLPALNGIAEVVIHIISVNDAPVITGQISIQTNEDTPFTLLSSHLLVTDVDNTYPDDFSILIQNGTNYTLSNNQIIPALNYHGTLTVPVQVNDGESNNSNSNTFNLSLTVLPVNDPPIASNDRAYTAENTPINITVLGNDNDSNDPLGGIDASSLKLITLPNHGSAVILPDQTLNYTPFPGYSGRDTLRYSIGDVGYPLPSQRDTAYVFIEISRLSPVANNDVASTNEDTPVSIDVLDNDTDSGDDINPSTVQISRSPQHGSILVQEDGVVVYTPSINYNGIDSFRYTVKDYTNLTSNIATVQITINPVNDAPITNNESYNTQEEVPLIIPISEIAVDPENELDMSSFTITQNPENGTIEINEELNQVVYTPNNNFSGNDQFSFEISDIQGLLSNNSTVSILVSDQAPKANDDEFIIKEDETTVMNVVVNDTDPQNNLNPLSIEIVTEPLNGIASVNTSNGNINYTPTENYFGNDVLEYLVYDEDGYSDKAKVTIFILSVNDAPSVDDDQAETDEDASISINVLSNDQDIDGEIIYSTLNIVDSTQYGILSLIDGTGQILYTPDANFFGSDQFTYRVCDDSSACNTATVSITIKPINDPPVANDDIVQVYSKVTTTINVLDNDFDPENRLDTTSLRIVTPPEKGIIKVPSKGKINYTSNNGYIGLDDFEYEICDTEGSCDIAKVTINITSGNTAPVTQTDYFEIQEDEVSSLRILDNDYDANDNIDISTLKITYPDTPSDKVLADTIEGIIIYTPSQNYFGTDTLVYEICDDESLCGKDTVYITILPVNDPPVAVEDYFEALDGKQSSFNVLINDYDIDPDDLLNTSQLTIDNNFDGQISLSSGGELNIEPVLGSYCNSFTFTYQLCDSTNVCNTGSIIIDVIPSDDDIDGISNYMEGTVFDTDDDSNLNYRDTDSDADNIPDSIESGIVDICIDYPIDTDLDGIPDYLDDDSDADGVSDKDEGLGDCDEDGIPNYIDYFDDCNGRVKAPNTFSPNGDGKNDYFVIPAVDEDNGYPENELAIYNRWGAEVFKMKNYNNTWDGRSSSSTLGTDILPEGTYFYVLKLKTDGKIIKTINGMVYIKH